jgi:hypothetical protein
MTLRISGRAPTHLGIQGDHVSAYQLIVNAAHTVVADSSWDTVKVRVFSLFIHLTNIRADITVANGPKGKNLHLWHIPKDRNKEKLIEEKEQLDTNLSPNFK